MHEQATSQIEATTTSVECASQNEQAIENSRIGEEKKKIVFLMALRVFDFLNP